MMMPRFFPALLPFATGVAILVLLAGCTTPEATVYPTEPVYPIQAMAQPRALRVAAPGADGQIPAAERTRIFQFIDGYRDGGRGPLRISVTGLTPNRADRTLDTVRDLAQRRGLPPEALLTAAVPGGAPGVTLDYTGYVAVPPECRPELGQPSGGRNEVSPNYGCAWRRSLAAMIANPVDLIEPAPSGPYDAARLGVTLDKYRKGTAPALAAGTSFSGLGK